MVPLSRSEKRRSSLLKEFSKATTIHGLSYVFSEDSNRFAWTCVVFLSMLLAVMASISYYVQWQSEPVLTSVINTAAPITEIEFPAITVCAQGSLQSAMDEELRRQFETFLKNRDLRQLSNHQIRLEHRTMMQTLFVGLDEKASPDFLINTMLADNVNNVVAATVISNDGLDTCKLKSNMQLLNQCDRITITLTNTTKHYCLDLNNDCHKTNEEDFLNLLFNNQLWTAIASSQDLNETFVLPISKKKLLLEASKLVRSSVFLINSNDSKWTTNDNDCVQAQLLMDQNLIELSPRDCDEESLGLCITQICPKPHEEEEEVARLRRRHLIQLALDPEQRERRANRTEVAFDTVRNIFAKLDKKASFPALFELLWHGSFPCFDSERQQGMLKKCIWREKEVNCSELFEATPTNLGMCCSFNLREVDSVFRESPFVEEVRRQRQRDTNTNLEEKEKMDEELRAESGLSRGLSLVLDLHSNELSSSSVSSSFTGFTAYVHPSTTYPSTPELFSGTMVQGGHETRVAIGTTLISMQEDLASVPASLRRCLGVSEKSLKAHKHYDMTACLLECNMQRALDSAERSSDVCIPWYLPKLSKEDVVCDPWATRRFVVRMQTKLNNSCSEQCPPNCVEAQYFTSSSSAKIRKCDFRSLATNPLCNLQTKPTMHPSMWAESVLAEMEEEKEDSSESFSIIQSNMRKTIPDRFQAQQLFTFRSLKGDRVPVKEIDYDAFDEDIALLTFFFDKPTMMHFQRQVRTTTLGFVAQIGGLLGLCLGFSLVSAIEIIYWLLIKPITRR